MKRTKKRRLRDSTSPRCHLPTRSKARTLYVSVQKVDDKVLVASGTSLAEGRRICAQSDAATDRTARFVSWSKKSMRKGNSGAFFFFFLLGVKRTRGNCKRYHALFLLLLLLLSLQALRAQYHALYCVRRCGIVKVALWWLEGGKKCNVRFFVFSSYSTDLWYECTQRV